MFLFKIPYAWYKAWPSGYYQTCCAWSGTIWARVLPCSQGWWSATVQPYRSVFPGHQSYQMEQSCQKKMLQRQWPCKSKFQKANPGLPEAVTRVSNVGDQLICWPCVAKKNLHSCWYMNSCNVGHSYSATLTATTSIGWWRCQQRRRIVNRSSLRNSRHISASSETNMTVCHLHYAKSKEHNNNDDINSSDCENSYIPPCVFVPDE